jgi:hypothetical protein
MLVGMPLLATRLASAVWPNLSISAAIPQHDTAGESRGEALEEEREEREEEVESKVHLLISRLASGRLDLLYMGLVEQRMVPAGSGPRLSLRSIRGPPVA